MTRVLFYDTAKADLLEAWLFIAEESMDAADDVIEAIDGVTVLRVLHHARDIPNLSMN